MNSNNNLPQPQQKSNCPPNVLKRIASLQLQGKNDHQQDILKIMAGDAETIKLWSAPLTNQERLGRNNAIFDHWLSGKTTTEIAKNLHITRQEIDYIIKHAKDDRRNSLCITEQPPIYNVWNYANCDPRFGRDGYPGRIPGQAIVNLLLWLTKPFDVVVDPMAGGGTTIDVCKYLLRRYYCYDITPSRPDIKKWDICGGYPRLPQKPKLIILDPPYWRLKRNHYSPESAAMTSYQEWLGFMRKLAKDSFKHLGDKDIYYARIPFQNPTEDFMPHDSNYVIKAPESEVRHIENLLEELSLFKQLTIFKKEPQHTNTKGGSDGR